MYSTKKCINWSLDLFKFKTPKKRKDFNDRNLTVILYYKDIVVYTHKMDVRNFD